MASAVVAAAAIIGGLSYFHRATGQKANPDLTNIQEEGHAHENGRPQRQYATMSFMNRFARANGEVVVTQTNAANNPNLKSIHAVDPELEFLARRIRHAPPIEEFFNK